MRRVRAMEGKPTMMTMAASWRMAFSVPMREAVTERIWMQV